MKHLFRKGFAVFLAALTLCLALSATALAVDPPTVALKDFSASGGTINVTPAHAGDSFAAYQVVAATYDAATNTAHYDFSANAKKYIATLSAPVTMAAYQRWGDDSAELLGFLAGFAAYVKTTPTLTPDDSKIASSAGPVSFSVTTAGQYVILGTGNTSGCYVYQLMTAALLPDANYSVPTSCTLACKSSVPSITKTVDDGQVHTGQVVTYTVTFNVPTFAAGATNHALYVTDALPLGLTPTAGSAKITVLGAGADATPATLDAGAYTDKCLAGDLRWDFDSSKLAGYVSVTIAVACTVNEQISLTAPTTNTAVLHYSSDPFGSDATATVQSSADIYYSGVRLTKYNNKDAVLPGTVFALYRAASDAQEQDELIESALTTDARGQVTVKGLDSGEYYFVEVSASTGYILNNTKIPVTLPDRSKEMTAAQIADMADGLADVTAVNNPFAFILPHTGGAGTWIFTIAGVLLMASAVAVLLVHKKKSNH